MATFSRSIQRTRRIISALNTLANGCEFVRQCCTLAPSSPRYVYAFVQPAAQLH